MKITALMDACMKIKNAQLLFMHSKCSKHEEIKHILSANCLSFSLYDIINNLKSIYIIIHQ